MMSFRTNLPASASIGHPTDSAALVAPSAARNADAICEVLQSIAPKTGRALEIASGTGQHITVFAGAMPQLTWTPSDIDPTRIASIAHYVAEARLPNCNAPVTLDATAPGWSETMHGIDLIVLVNLLHLISEDEVQTLLKDAAMALAPGGLIVIYGPFMRGGDLTSDGDEAFHQSLTAADPEIGYKDDFDVIDWAMENWLDLNHALELPANNLALVFSKPE